MFAACGYAAATVLFAAHLYRHGGMPKAAWTARRVMACGALLHAAHIAHHAATFRECPVKTINTGVSFGAFFAVAIYLALRKVWKLQGIGIFVAPVALMFLLAGRFLAMPSVPPGVRTNLLPLHIAVNVLGDAFFLLASGAAALYLFQEHQLKIKKAVSFGKLPPLVSLDRANHGFLLTGFLLMTVGVVTGTFWVSRLHFGTATEILRLAFGYLSWLVFCGVLLLRSTLGWRGRRAAWGTLAGFLFALVVVSLYLRGSEIVSQ